MHLLKASQKTVSHSRAFVACTNDLDTAVVPALRSKPKCCGGWLHSIMGAEGETSVLPAMRPSLLTSIIEYLWRRFLVRDELLAKRR